MLEIPIGSKEGKRNITRELPHYNFVVIISVEYRVKPQRGVAFRKWTASILKDYIIKGYTINQKKLDTLHKIVEIQARILVLTLELDEKKKISLMES